MGYICNVKIEILSSENNVKLALDTRKGTFDFSFIFERDATLKLKVPTLIISNLSRDFFNEDFIARAGNGDKITVEAGYNENLSLLFSGFVVRYLADFNGITHDLAISCAEGNSIPLENNILFTQKTKKSIYKNTNLRAFLNEEYTLGQVIYNTLSPALDKNIDKLSRDYLSVIIDDLCYLNDLLYCYFNLDLIVYDLKPSETFTDLENFKGYGTIRKGACVLSSITQRESAFFREEGEKFYVVWQVPVLFTTKIKPSDTVQVYNSLGGLVKGVVTRIEYSLSKQDSSMNLLILEERFA